MAKLEHPSLSMAGLRQTEFFLRELRMTGKVRRKKSEA